MKYQTKKVCRSIEDQLRDEVETYASKRDIKFEKKTSESSQFSLLDFEPHVLMQAKNQTSLFPRKRRDHEVEQLLLQIRCTHRTLRDYLGYLTQDLQRIRKGYTQHLGGAGSRLSEALVAVIGRLKSNGTARILYENDLIKLKADIEYFSIDPSILERLLTFADLILVRNLCLESLYSTPAGIDASCITLDVETEKLETDYAKWSIVKQFIHELKQVSEKDLLEKLEWETLVCKSQLAQIKRFNGEYGMEVISSKALVNLSHLLDETEEKLRSEGKKSGVLSFKLKHEKGTLEKEAFSVDPKEKAKAEALFVEGLAYLEQNAYSDAVGCLKSAIEILQSQTPAKYYATLGEAYLGFSDSILTDYNPRESLETFRLAAVNFNKQLQCGEEQSEDDLNNAKRIVHRYTVYFGNYLGEIALKKIQGPHTLQDPWTYIIGHELSKHVIFQKNCFCDASSEKHLLALLCEYLKPIYTARSSSSTRVVLNPQPQLALIKRSSSSEPELESSKEGSKEKSQGENEINMAPEYRLAREKYKDIESTVHKAIVGVLNVWQASRSASKEGDGMEDANVSEQEKFIIMNEQARRDGFQKGILRTMKLSFSAKIQERLKNQYKAYSAVLTGDVKRKDDRLDRGVNKFSRYNEIGRSFLGCEVNMAFAGAVELIRSLRDSQYNTHARNYVNMVGSENELRRQVVMVGDELAEHFAPVIQFMPPGDEGLLADYAADCMIQYSSVSHYNGDAASIWKRGVVSGTSENEDRAVILRKNQNSNEEYHTTLSEILRDPNKVLREWETAIRRRTMKLN